MARGTTHETAPGRLRDPELGRAAVPGGRGRPQADPGQRHARPQRRVRGQRRGRVPDGVRRRGLRHVRRPRARRGHARRPRRARFVLQHVGTFEDGVARAAGLGRRRHRHGRLRGADRRRHVRRGARADRHRHPRAAPASRARRPGSGARDRSHPPFDGLRTSGGARQDRRGAAGSGAGSRSWEGADECPEPTSWPTSRATELAAPHPPPRRVAGRGRRRGASSASRRATRASTRSCSRASTTRGGGAGGRGGVIAGEELGAAARRAGGDEGPVRLQAGLDSRPSAASARCKDFVDRRPLRVRRAHRAGRRHPRRQDQQPRDGLPRHHRQLPVRPLAQPVRHHPQHRRLVRRQRRRPSPTAWCRSPRAPTAAARSASRPRGAASTAIKPSFGRVPIVVRPNAFVADQPVPRRGADHAHRRRRRAGDDRAQRLRLRATRTALPGKVDYRGALEPVDRGHAHRLQPRPRRLPGRPGASPRRCGARSTRSRRPGAIVEEVTIEHRAHAPRAGRPVVPHDHRRSTSAPSRSFKDGGIDLLRRPPRRLPAGVPALDRRTAQR